MGILGMMGGSTMGFGQMKQRPGMNQMYQNPGTMNRSSGMLSGQRTPQMRNPMNMGGQLSTQPTNFNQQNRGMSPSPQMMGQMAPNVFNPNGNPNAMQPGSGYRPWNQPQTTQGMYGQMSAPPLTQPMNQSIEQPEEVPGVEEQQNPVMNQLMSQYGAGQRGPMQGGGIPIGNRIPGAMNFRR